MTVAGEKNIAPPKVLLFDLGGVLIEFTGLREIAKLLPSAAAPEAIRQRWLSSIAMRDFELGACSEREFALRFVDEWNLRIEPTEFLPVFSSWVKPTFPGASELLDRLRGRYILACLSNTNATHWPVMLRQYKLSSMLDKHFASHELRQRKPEPAIFSSVCHALQCEPAEVAFFDDGSENIEGAKRAGLNAHLVDGIEALKRKLTELGFT